MGNGKHNAGKWMTGKIPHLKKFNFDVMKISEIKRREWGKGGVNQVLSLWGGFNQEEKEK